MHCKSGDLAMAKLFCTITTEKTDKHQQANDFLKIKVFYGSKDDSREAFTILIEANKEDTLEKPKITVVNAIARKEGYARTNLIPWPSCNMTKQESEELLTRAGRDIEEEEETIKPNCEKCGQQMQLRDEQKKPYWQCLNCNEILQIGFSGE